MNKVFNRLQTLKSSENCDKYSKRFLYKNLVGGTTTICTDIKQNQRLSKGSANKPLTAVGTLTSLLCNSAKVVEKWSQILPIFKLIKILGLVLVLFVGVVSESLAEETKICGDRYGEMPCLNGIEKNDKGEYICGTDCTFTVDGTTLNVKANSKNATISAGIFSDTYYSGGKVVTTSGDEINFNKIELDGDFASIGRVAFYNTNATIIPKSGTLKLLKSGKRSAAGTHNQGDVYVANSASAQGLQMANINGNLIFADGITYIGTWFMGRATIDGDVVIPASVTSIDANNWITVLDSLGEGHKVYCGAGNCYKLFYDSCYKNERETMQTECLSALKRLSDSGKLAAYNNECTDYKCQSCRNNYDYIKSGTGCVSDCGAGYLGKEKECIDSALGCGENYRDMGGFCNRIRYTPAEAAQVLHNDNTNSVTITFKK